MSRSPGAALQSSDPADIELLTAIFDDLKADRDDNLTGGPAFMGLFGVRHVLAEVLGLPYAWNPESRPEDQADPGSQPFQESGSDDNDEAWVEEWDPESLYRWVLDEIRGLQPQDVTARCRGISKRLSERPAVSDGVQFLKAGALPGAMSGLTEGGSPSIKRAEEDPAAPCPISFLPVELLRHIFHFAHAHRSEIRIAVTLSHVSSYFRSVALGMTSLWTTIDDLLPIPIIELYIARAGEEVLQFRTCAGRVGRASLLPTSQHLDILLKESRRIQSMEVYGFDPKAFTRWAGLLDERDPIFSSLVKLDLVISSSDQGGSQFAESPVWEWFPSLQDLWIQGYPSNCWGSPSEPLPQSLRRLKLSRGGPIWFEELLDALQGLANLKVLSMDHCSLEFSLSQKKGRSGITMTCLEKLEVAQMSVQGIMGLASHINTPNLAALSVTYPVGLDLAEAIIPFTKAHPRLDSLLLQECSMGSGGWSSVLENSVHLNHLAIRGSNLCDDDLRALATTAIIPNITHLTLENELRLTTSIVEQVVRTHPHLISVILRGWDSSNVSKENAEVIARLVPHVRIEAIGKLRDVCGGDSGSEEDDWDDSYWEGSDFSEDDGWLSGDEAIRTQGEL
ncbi:hypothetical protein FRC05_010534 [Tulasnella sp. 425]|nr:hypothetical protein FRC05_010534 [Tulasnella sp. 425]